MINKTPNILISHMNACITSILMILLLLSQINLFAQTKSLSTNSNKIACLQLKDFPTIDAPAISRETLTNALKDYNVDYLNSVSEINQKLNNKNYGTLMLPYGSAFPVDTWDAIYSFIKHGGNLILLGGYPFHQPVIWESGNNTDSNTGEWVPGTPQPTYAHQLLIGPADTIDLNSSAFYSQGAKIVSVDKNDFKAESFPMPSKIFELTVRFTTKKDFPGTDGTSGPRDAVLRPLIHVVNSKGLPVACPLLEIDRMQGSEAGGRWIIEPSDAVLSSQIIKRCVQLAVEGSVEMQAYPVHASVKQHEVPVIRVNLFKRGNNDEHNSAQHVEIKVTNSSGNLVFSKNTELTGYGKFKTAEIPIITNNILTPGFYSVDVHASNVSWHPSSIKSGFWVWDQQLINSAPKLSVSKDWILKNGKVFPIVGTTYMASDVDRKFLFEPNPYLWNKDFAEMEKLGVNFVRTGIWTGWSRMMLDPGAIDEGVLTAIDAFIQSAARHNIVICFNLFGFTPPLNGGSNPYLDPRALEWQKVFITLIASRYKNNGWITYDLINEPSYSPPDKIWNNLPINDKYEKEAWKEWIIKHHGTNEDILRDAWRQANGNIFSVPSPGDLTYARVRENKLPRKALDFELFTQDVVTNWADELTKTIKASGGNELVTLGQDEGGTMNRPSQQFHYTAVDFTSIHDWWNNDDLLWDVVSTKVPEKPSLISETGIMRLEDIDGEAWRDPFAAKKLLERKFAYAFAGRGAGVLEWAWNINPYQPIDNEAVIGFFRPDGTAKIELEALMQYAKFFSEAKSYLSDYEKDPVILVIPHSKLFSGRPNAMEGVQRYIRILADNFGIVPTMLSEYKLSKERLDDAKLIIVPDPEMLYDSAAVQIYDASKRGTKVLITGAIDGNEYGKMTPAIKNLVTIDGSAPVTHYEETHWKIENNGGSQFVTFDQNKSEYLRKSNFPEPASWKGNILHEPLPLAEAREKGALSGLLNSVLNYSGITAHYSEVPVTARVLKTKKFALITCVNESNKDLTRNIYFDKHEIQVPVKAGRTRILIVNRISGKMIISTEGKNIVQLK